jgi:sterol desaturase/sphingolipid hydroxylase (fatty acid hydroxylase superfamily)
MGNYASFFVVWDSVFGTNKAFKDVIQSQNGKKVKQD